MQITDIKIRKLFEEGPMKAVVSVTFDSQLAVHDIKVIHARDRFFIVMPSRKNPDDTYRDIVHPINAQFRATLEDAVIRAYEEALAAADELSFEEPAPALYVYAPPRGEVKNRGGNAKAFPPRFLLLRTTQLHRMCPSADLERCRARALQT